MADDIVTRLRNIATDQARHRTHYEGCSEYHIECAALILCDEIERMRTECERLQQLLHAAPGWAERPFMHTVLAMEQQAEIERLRTLIARFAVADRTWEFTQKYDEDYYDVEREYQDALVALLQEASRG